MEYRVVKMLYPSMCSSLHGMSLDILFSGCSRRCRGCHNPKLWDFIEPSVSMDTVLFSARRADKAKVISIMGGEPLEQDGILDFIKSLLYVTKKRIALFTGYEFMEVPEDIKECIDYLKVGGFEDNNRTPLGSFLASKNQKMYQKVGGLWTVDWEYVERGRCIGKEENGRQCYTNHSQSVRY